MSEPMQFKVGEWYTGKCDEVRVAKRGDSMVMEFGFTIGDEFRDFTVIFLGSEKIDKGGKTADERVKDDLASFGCDRQKMEEGAIMTYIRSVMIGKEIEVQAGEYNGAVQFKGIRRMGSTIVVTENPFGVKKATPPAGAGGGLF